MTKEKAEFYELLSDRYGVDGDNLTEVEFIDKIIKVAEEQAYICGEYDRDQEILNRGLQDEYFR